MKTKFLVKFLNNSAHLDADLELVDVIHTLNSDGRLKQGADNFVFDMVNPEKHTKLSTRANSNQSRKLAVSHLKSTVRAAFIKRLYETTTIYFQDILKAATLKGLNVDRLIGEHSIKLTSRELIVMGDFDKIVDHISSEIFRQLENERSTKKLIEKMDKKLGLGVGDEVVHNALPYLELRHLLVHNDGKSDQDFCITFPFIEAEVGKRIKLTDEIIRGARNGLKTLIKEFDKKVVSLKLVDSNELQP